MTAHRFGEFSVGINFDGDQAIVGVAGDVDALTAPTLGAVLYAIVDQDHPRVVLDLAALTFLGAAGLRVIAEASARLGTSGGVLTLRSSPAQTRRILDITGMNDLVRLDVQHAAVAALGPEQRVGDHSLAVDGGPADASADLRADLARAGSMRATNTVIDAALQLITALASATIEGADGVSVSLERHGRPMTVAASNDTIQRMDDHQYETGEGPCLTAMAEGRWFHIESLAEESRWPAFRPRAIEEGIVSILSTPLMSADRPIGALNIYSNTERVFGTHQQELAALFATQASGILTGAGADVTDEQVDKRILDALLAREAIALAKGVLMARQHISADAAAATLYRQARAADVPVLEQAFEVVGSTDKDVDPDLMSVGDD